MNPITTFQSTLTKEDKFPGIQPGWTIRVNQRIKEGEKTRVQAFEGMVIGRKHGGEAGGTITVRKMAGDFGVEKIFPIYLPSIESVKVVRKVTTRRAKLYYIREKTTKEIRKKLRADKALISVKVPKEDQAVKVPKESKE